MGTVMAMIKTAMLMAKEEGKAVNLAVLL